MARSSSHQCRWFRLMVDSAGAHILLQCNTPTISRVRLHLRAVSLTSAVALDPLPSSDLFSSRTFEKMHDEDESSVQRSPELLLLSDNLLHGNSRARECRLTVYKVRKRLVSRPSYSNRIQPRPSRSSQMIAINSTGSTCSRLFRNQVHYHTIMLPCSLDTNS